MKYLLCLLLLVACGKVPTAPTADPNPPTASTSGGSQTTASNPSTDPSSDSGGGTTPSDPAPPSDGGGSSPPPPTPFTCALRDGDSYGNEHVILCNGTLLDMNPFFPGRPNFNIYVASILNKSDGSSCVEGANYSNGQKVFDRTKCSTDGVTWQ